MLEYIIELVTDDEIKVKIDSIRMLADIVDMFVHNKEIINKILSIYKDLIMDNQENLLL